jgi:hypothetical protein
MPREYVTLVGDVVGSKTIQNREAFRRRLQSACDHVNSAFSKDFYAKVKLIKGVDEVSGVLTRLENVYRIIQLIYQTIHPHLSRFAIVYGPLDIGLASKDAARMDGTAFHKAADTIAQLKKTGDLVAVQLGDDLVDRLLTSHMNLVFFLQRGWTERQFELATLYRKLGSQEKVAKRLDIIQPTVSKALKAANYDEILRAEESINEALAEYQKRLLKEVA